MPRPWTKRLLSRPTRITRGEGSTPWNSKTGQLGALVQLLDCKKFNATETRFHKSITIPINPQVIKNNQPYLAMMV